jgi:hypothetical protein
VLWAAGGRTAAGLLFAVSYACNCFKYRWFLTNLTAMRASVETEQRRRIGGRSGVNLPPSSCGLKTGRHRVIGGVFLKIPACFLGLILGRF